MTAPASAIDSLRAAVVAPFIALRSLRVVPGVLRLQAVNGLAVTGRWAEAVALTVVAFRVGGPELVAVAVVARKLPSALLAPALGSVIEWRAPLTVLRWTVTAAAIFACVSAVAVLSDGGVAVAIVAAAGLGLCGVARRVANSVIAPSMVDDGAQLTGMAVITRGVDAVGLAVGPALAGVLVAIASPTVAYLAVVATNLTALALLRHLHGAGTSAVRPRLGGAAGTRARRSRPGLTLRPLRNADVRRIVLICGAQTTFFGCLDVLVAPLAVDELAIGEGGVGLLNAAAGVGGVVALVPLFGLAGTRRLARLLMVGLLLSGAPVVVFVGIDAAPFVAVLCLGLVGFGDVVYLGTMVATLQRASDPSTLGRSFALVEAAQALGFVVGAVIAAVLADRAPSSALAIVGGVVVSLAVLSLRWALSLDRRLQAPTDIVGKLRVVPAFELLSPQAIERLALGVDRQVFEPGDRIITQGEPGTTYFLVESGTVQVTVDGHPIRTLESGDGFGEIALLRVVPRTATCTATTPVEVFAIDGDDFLAVLGLHSAALDETAGSRLSDAAPRLSEIPRFE